jgi:hypothetical protein
VSDLLKHSVEMTLRKVFKIIRSVKSTALPDQNVQGPEVCSKVFTDAFAKLSDDLSDHGITTRQNMYYRVMTAWTNDHEVVHRAEAPAPRRTEKPTPKPTVKFVEPKSEKRREEIPRCARVIRGNSLLP